MRLVQFPMPIHFYSASALNYEMLTHACTVIFNRFTATPQYIQHNINCSYLMVLTSTLTLCRQQTMRVNGTIQ